MRAVIVLARHGVRAPIASETRAEAYNAQPWPQWPVASGVLTPHGAQALRLLGAFYRGRYAALLSAPCQSLSVYAEANTTQRTIASAHAFMEGMLPACPVEVHSLPGKENPLYWPTDNDRAVQEQVAAALAGRMNGSPEAFGAAFDAELGEAERVLTACEGKDCAKKTDFRQLPESLRLPAGRDLLDVDGQLTLGADFAENFLLEYCEGLPLSQVGWGRLSRQNLNRLMEMNTRYHDFVLRTPLLAQVGASGLAARIQATLDSAAAGKPAPLAFGKADDRFFLLHAHDTNLAWMGGLLRLDWLLPDQTFNATPPGGALVFELHRDRKSGAHTVQVFFIAQTLEQIRSLSQLDGERKPQVVPIFVPGCSGPAPAFACRLEDFDRVVNLSIDKQYTRFLMH